MKFLAWILSLLFAFNLGAQTTEQQTPTDSELRSRVQEHIDVIVDESAAIVDEVANELRNDPGVQEAEQFIQDVQEVAQETLDDLSEVADNARDRLQEKFGKEETGESPETIPPEEPAQIPEETPAPHEPVNG